MSESNVIQHDWGYELTWANHSHYSGKIFAFTSVNAKTPFFFNSETDKTFFVSTGKFKVRWIETATGNIFEQELDDGKVFDCPRMMPCSLQALTKEATVAVTTSGEKDDRHIVIKSENF